MFGEVIHDQVYELDLIRGQRFPGQERAQSRLGCLTVESHQRAHEEPQAVRRLFRLVDFLGTADASFAKHAFQLGHICRRERAIHAQLVDGDVILMGPQERPRLGAKSLEIIAGLEAGQFNVDLRA